MKYITPGFYEIFDSLVAQIILGAVAWPAKKRDELYLKKLEKKWRSVPSGTLCLLTEATSFFLEGDRTAVGKYPKGYMPIFLKTEKDRDGLVFFFLCQGQRMCYTIWSEAQHQNGIMFKIYVA